MPISTIILLLLAGVELSAAGSTGTPPAITSFTANPAKVTAGQPSTLSWVVTGYPSVTVSPGVGAVNGTWVRVTPSTTQTYTLKATNSSGSTTATVTVAAGRAPTITSFTATPAKVTAGQAVTLSWAVTGSPTLTLNPDGGSVGGTSVKVVPSTTTAYILTARDRKSTRLNSSHLVISY